MCIKPILFNTEMVRAILDGRKTVTRRVVKPQPTSKMFTGVCTDSTARSDKAVGQWFFGDKPGTLTEGARPPYQSGDILYVRETWKYIDFTGEDDGYVYKASQNGKDWEENSEEWEWHPSIHMPKEAARIWLKVTNVRVERLIRMSHEAAKQEGIHYCESPDGFTWKVDSDMNCCYVTPSGAFEALWNGTVNKDDMDRYGWEANPWVWVIEFEQCKKPEEVVL